MYELGKTELVDPKDNKILRGKSVMSNLFDEASDIIGLSRDLTLQDYKKFKEIQKNSNRK